MPLSEPVSETIQRGAVAETPGESTPTPWIEACRRFGEGGWFWLATVAADGAPHVTPVFAAWDTSAFFVASHMTSPKSRHLVRDGRCVVSKDAGDLHLVVEGIAQRVLADDTLERAADAFRSVYGWTSFPVEEEVDAEYGAPVETGPAYAVWEIKPTTAFGFPVDSESYPPTRWRFPAGLMQV